jgi:hypothetical protein
MRLARSRQFATLAAMTALEVVRRPVVTLLTAACVVVTALTPLLLLHAFGEDGKLARDSGLAVHFVLGLFVAGYAAATLSDERRGGTAASVLSKPVGRTLFFLAKFAGVAAVLAAFSFCAVLATLLAARTAEQFSVGPGIAGHVTDWQTGLLLLAAPFAALAAAGYLNFTRRRAVGASAFGALMIGLALVLFAAGCFDRFGHPAPYDLRVDARLIPAGALVTLALLTLGALAVTLAARLDTAPTMLACSFVFLAGLMADSWMGRLRESVPWAAGLLGAFPNWRHFWMADALSGGGCIPWGYVAQAGGYAALLSAAVLCAGACLFQSADVT